MVLNYDVHMKNDLVNHPAHYNDSSGIECITYIRQFDDPNSANAFKYLWRLGKKDGNSIEQDVAKSLWYVNDRLTHSRVSHFPWYELAADWIVGKLTKRNKKVFHTDDLRKVQSSTWIIIAMDQLCQSEVCGIAEKMQRLEKARSALTNYRDTPAKWEWRDPDAK